MPGVVHKNDFGQNQKQIRKTITNAMNDLKSTKATTTTRRHRNSMEHRLQCACVRWFRLSYPHLRKRLFAVPNGGARSKVEAAKLKAEGVVAGVSDLILLKPSRNSHALLIEMKTDSKGSKQSESQKEWQECITAEGEYQYSVCRSLEDFICTINAYLDNFPQTKNE